MTRFLLVALTAPAVSIRATEVIIVEITSGHSVSRTVRSGHATVAGCAGSDGMVTLGKHSSDVALA
jgi:hypothetical protein